MKGPIAIVVLLLVLTLTLVVVWQAVQKETPETVKPGGPKPRTGLAEKDPTKYDKAVKRGLKFLLAQQNEDGSFGKMFKIGVTSLVVHSIVSLPKGYKTRELPEIKKAVQFILKKEHIHGNGGIYNEKEGLFNYNSSMALLALSAVDDPAYKSVVKRLQKYVMSLQYTDPNIPTQYGGIGYGSKKDKPDMSNTSLALAALRESGVPQDSEVFKRAKTFISRCQADPENNDMHWAKLVREKDKGSGVYKPNESKAGVWDTVEHKLKDILADDGRSTLVGYGSITYALFLSFAYCGLDKDDSRVKNARGWLERNYTLEENPNMKGQGLFYYYYTMARALDTWGEKTIKSKGLPHKWAVELANKLASLQDYDGSWINKESRWFETDKTLITAYVLKTMSLAIKNMD